VCILSIPGTTWEVNNHGNLLKLVVHFPAWGKWVSSCQQDQGVDIEYTISELFSLNKLPSLFKAQPCFSGCGNVHTAGKSTGASVTVWYLAQIIKIVYKKMPIVKVCLIEQSIISPHLKAYFPVISCNIFYDLHSSPQ